MSRSLTGALPVAICLYAATAFSSPSGKLKLTPGGSPSEIKRNPNQGYQHKDSNWAVRGLFRAACEI